MNQKFIDQTVALAAVIQSTIAVDSLAYTGFVKDELETPLIHSLFQTDPETIEDVYGNYKSLSLGFEILSKNMMKTAPVNALKYFATIISLEKKLAQRRDLLTVLSHGIEETKKKLEFYPQNHENIIASLADIYLNTVSKLAPRIMIQGEPEYLNLEQNKNHVRTLLLAGIRSSMLWHQRGGSRLTLLFSQQKIITTAKFLYLEYR